MNIKVIELALEQLPCGHWGIPPEKLMYLVMQGCPQDMIGALARIHKDKPDKGETTVLIGEAQQMKRCDLH